MAEMNQKPATPETDKTISLILEKESFFKEFKELLFPPKQPELKLESKPIPVKDIWTKDEKSFASRMGSVGVHLAVVGVMCLPFWRPVQQQLKKVMEVPVFVPPPPEKPPEIVVHHLAGGSPAPSQVARPQVQTQALHAFAAPTQVVSLSSAMSGPDMNMFAGSGPVGSPGGGGGGGGNGSGGDCYVLGPDCVAGPATDPPVLISSPDPEYSDEARKAKYQGTVNVDITIDSTGKVTKAVVEDKIGMGLDEKAVEAVLKWRFQPARYNGKPVPVTAVVQVNFRLY